MYVKIYNYWEIIFENSERDENLRKMMKENIFFLCFRFTWMCEKYDNMWECCDKILVLCGDKYIYLLRFRLKRIVGRVAREAHSFPSDHHLPAFNDDDDDDDEINHMSVLVDHSEYVVHK